MNKIDWKNQILNFVGVILGVLLAFYISERAERSKEKSLKRQMLHSLISDLEVDLQVYGELIPINENQSSDLENLVQSILPDYIDQDASTVNLNVENYTPANSTYLSIKSSGGINLLNDFELRKDLSKYYELELNETIELGELQLDFFLREITPWCIQNTELFNFESEDIHGDMKLANILTFYNVLINNKTNQYKTMRETADSLRLKLIELK